MTVQLYSLPGEFDGQLKWPVKAKFTIISVGTTM